MSQPVSLSDSFLQGPYLDFNTCRGVITPVDNEFQITYSNRPDLVRACYLRIFNCSEDNIFWFPENTLCPHNLEPYLSYVFNRGGVVFTNSLFMLNSCRNFRPRLNRATTFSYIHISDPVDGQVVRKMFILKRAFLASLPIPHLEWDCLTLRD